MSTHNGLMEEGFLADGVRIS